MLTNGTASTGRQRVNEGCRGSTKLKRRKELRRIALFWTNICKNTATKEDTLPPPPPGHHVCLRQNPQLLPDLCGCFDPTPAHFISHLYRAEEK